MNRFIVGLLICVLVLPSCGAPTHKLETQAYAQTVVASPTPLITEVFPASPTGTIAPLSTKVPVEASSTPQTVNDALAKQVIEYEMKGAFDFFWKQANTQTGSPGYGLIRDRYPGSEGIASIASLGFGLTAYLIGIEKGYITYQEGYDRVNQTLDTLSKLERPEGFFFHFLDMASGKRAWNSEVSSIDTAILMMGILSASEYFGGEIGVKGKQLYDEVNWSWFIDESKNMFYMAYRPEKGFEGHWDFYAEQLMLYVLAAGSDTYPMDYTTYYAFTRHSARYGAGKPFIHSWFGSIFTYQFSHAWIDFRGYQDKKGTDWFQNSVDASLAQYQFAVDNADEYMTLGPSAWGLTACDGPGGYNGTYGAPPSGYDNNSHYVDDTVAPAAAIGSIIFVPQQSLQAMLNYYSIDKIKGSYGFVDAYNLSDDWYDSDVIGIDKGISLLMLANYQDDRVYKITMQNDNLLNGLAILKITKSE